MEGTRLKVKVHSPREKGKANEELMKGFEFCGEAIREAAFYQGEGCGFCKGTGYYGREAIYEFLVLDEEIRKMIMAKAPASQIRGHAVKNGMKSLRQDGWDKVKRGLTTISEIIRVTQEVK